MKLQYIIRKYVMANSVAEALRKSKKTPIHEVYVDNNWLDKNKNSNVFEEIATTKGFQHKDIKK